MILTAERAAIANAFLFRCGGIADLALDYLKDALKGVCAAAGRPALSTPARGEGERFLDWLNAVRSAGVETVDLINLRAALDAVPGMPPPLTNLSAFTPATTGALARTAAAAASGLASDAHSREDWAAAVAGYWVALLLDPLDRLANLNLGVIYVKQEKWDGAVERLGIVLSQFPTERLALIGLHNIALTADRMSSLAPHLQALVKLQEQAPEPAADQDADEATPPVILLEESNGATVGALILRRGAAHVRSAINRERCLTLAEQAAVWFSANPTRLSLPLLEIAPQYDNPTLLLEREMIAVLEKIFGRMPTISATDTYLRIVKPETADTYIPFHQDVTALATTGVNVWVPLTDCGVDAPGLEIMARRTSVIFPTVTSPGDYNQMEIEAEAVYRDFPEKVRFYPTPSVGDAVLFLGSTVHRSYIAPSMTRMRTSLELRFY